MHCLIRPFYNEISLTAENASHDNQGLESC